MSRRLRRLDGRPPQVSWALGGTQATLQVTHTLLPRVRHEESVMFTQQEIAMRRILFLGLLLTVGNCSRPQHVKHPVGATDSSFAQLCASPPETTANGTVGCVLKDQSPPPPTVLRVP